MCSLFDPQTLHWFVYRVKRQQLWNYMRLTGKQIGVLYNFGAVMGQSEHYYLDTDGTMYMF